MRHFHLGLLAFVLLLPLGCGGGGGGGFAVPSVEGTGHDDDNDLLGADLERAGWDILIDDKGFGPFATGQTLTTRHVTSDPGLDDTDADGIDDRQEYLLRTDPRNPDTDGDGLTDLEEWKRWLTSPVSVDTDGDARGPDPQNALAPNPDLFDGAELHFDADGNLLGTSTSPILADTDGDGQTDYEEVGHAFRSLVIAEIPQAQVMLDGPIDVFLNVEYEESRGSETSYGTSVSTSNSSTVGASSSSTYEEHLSASVTVTAGVEAEASVDGGVTVSGEVSATVEGGMMWSSTETTSQESTRSLQRESSRLETDRRDKTEIASSGTISAGITVQNTSPSSTVRLESLGIAVRHWQRDDVGGPVFKTLGTLRPDIPGFTLAPGARSPVIRVSTEDVAPDVIRRFLASPSSLHLAPAYFDMVDDEGIDFAFLAENAFAQTALVEIHYGEGRSESYRVATNVDRTASGQLAGIKMREVMTSTLGKTWAESESTVAIGGAYPKILTEIDGYVGSTGFVPGTDDPASLRLWRTAMNRSGFRVEGDWGDIVLMPGDVITLTYVTDTDGDGLTDETEKFFGTKGVVDSDGDQLGDGVEAALGWWAGAPGVKATVETVPPEAIVLARFGYPRRVYSNPRLADTDEDGLRDDDERRKGTDPVAPDTDGDGLLDGVDPFPLIPGRRLYVDRYVQPGGNTPWADADGDLGTALATARQTILDAEAALPGTGSLLERADLARDPDDGTLPANIRTVAAAMVTEIWVADGEYVLSSVSDTFALVDGLGVYGGFTGGGEGGLEEQTRGARNADPVSNGTVLSGGGVAQHVITAAGIGRGAILDGFVITGGAVSGNGGGILCDGASPTLRNLLVSENQAYAGAGLYVSGATSHPWIESCRFNQNDGGGIDVASGAAVDVLDSSFTSNTNEGAIYCDTATLRVERCDFNANWGRNGGAIHVRFSDAIIRDSTFVGNSVRPLETLSTTLSDSPSTFLTRAMDLLEKSFDNTGADLACGGAIYQDHGTVTVLQCRFTANEATHGAAIRVRGSGFDTTGASLAVLQCSFAQNVVVGSGTSIAATRAQVILRNSILGAGLRPDFDLETLQPGFVAALRTAFDQNPQSEDYRSLTAVGTSQAWIVNQNCLFEDLCDPGNVTLTSLGNRVGAARFVGPYDLRLQSSSPAIDGGNNLGDYLPFTPGYQSPPALDLGGTARVVDGDGDGTATIDIGAYEFK